MALGHRLGGNPNIISHSAKHNKMADFDPSETKTPEPILMKLGMVDYVRDRALL